MFHVDSEVGRLRQVILHRPDLELKRLTPDNAADLLFDDVLWVAEAQAEHDAFAAVLRAARRQRALLRRTARADDGRSTRPRSTCSTGSSTRACTARSRSTRCAARWRGWTRPALATFLIGGITKREFLELAAEPRSIAFHSLDPDGFVLAPLPNVLYQRDTSCWIYGGVSVNAMRMQARMRETISDEAMYRWHPMFAAGDFEVWYHGADSAPRHHRGRRRPGDRQRRRAGRDERANHAAGHRDARAPAVLGRRRATAWWRSTCRRRGRSCTWTPC